MSKTMEQVRKEYEAMNWLALAETAKEAGIEPKGMSQAAIVDALMAIEEYACFH